MELTDILAISGKPGLYKLLTSSASSVIVQSLQDGKRVPVHAAHKISSLEDISMYTYDEDVPLKEVFESIYKKENGGQAISHKESSADLKAYMRSVLPDFDEERVYHSDLKKLFQWYNTLQELGLLDSEGEIESESVAESEEETESEDASAAENTEEKKED